MENFIEKYDFEDITPSKDGGVRKMVLKEGIGEQKPGFGDLVKVHYVVFYADGTGPESANGEEKVVEVFMFHYGIGEVIQGWELCISTMKKYEKCILDCRKDYAHGERGSLVKVPPNCDLTFEIELLDWEPADVSTKKDKGVLKKLLEEGCETETPNLGAEVTIDIELINNEAENKQENITFIIGENVNTNIPKGIEQGLLTFKKNEKSVLTLSPKYANPSTEELNNTIPSKKVKYEVKLLDFKNAPESWEMTGLQRIEHANLLKEKGKQFFSEKKYKVAINLYKRMLHFLSYTGINLESDKKNEAYIMNLAAHLNCSVCYFKLEKFSKSRYHAEKVIELDNQNVKAHFRLGEALYGLGHPSKALEHFTKCKALGYSGKDIDVKIRNSEKIINHEQKSQKSIYAKMFANFTIPEDKPKLPLEYVGRDVMQEDLGEWEDQDYIEDITSAQAELKDVDMIYI